MPVPARTLSTLVLGLAAALSFAQAGETEPAPVQTAEATGLVTLNSRGEDVRNVLFDLFTQAKKSFVLEPNARFVLYLSLRDVTFDEALAIVCSTAGLKSELDGGIYFLSKAPAKPSPAVEPGKVVRRLTAAEMSVPVTTKLAMVDLRALFREMGRQAGVVIEVDEAVPQAKVDAVFHQTPLDKALAAVTKAAGLEFVLTDHYSVRIRRPAAAASSQG
jgi:type II secretory pathway component GspD/PulD (secretin)